jgi:cell division protein FtsW (lipid II flippase)
MPARLSRPETLSERWQQRAPERQLLAWALVAIALGFLMLLGAGPKDGHLVRWLDLLPLLVLMASFGTAHLIFAALGFRGDQLILAVVALLCGIGLLAQYRMGAFTGEQVKPITFLILPVGVALMTAAMALTMNGRYRMLASMIWFWALLSLVLVGLLLVIGQRFRGGVYAVGFMTPTEPLKLTVVLFAAAFVDRHVKALSNWPGLIPYPPLPTLWPLLAFAGLLLTLLLWQRDLGMIVILGMALLALLLAGTRQSGYLIYSALIAGIGGYALLALFSHGQRRIAAWLDPFQDPTGSGWQILQGLSGMYAGGLWGEGFGQARPRYAPIAESDFIYAVIAEELGFAGSVLLLGFFLLLIARLFNIAARARGGFGMLTATGIATVFAIQTFLNVGGVTKFIPLTGITLPFISQGGSSLVTAFLSLGLVMAISDGEPKPIRGKTSARRSPAKATRKTTTTRKRAKTALNHQK